MSDKSKVKPRCVNLSDYHWGILTNIAEQETSKSTYGKVNCIDVLRHAIDDIGIKASV